MAYYGKCCVFCTYLHTLKYTSIHRRIPTYTHIHMYLYTKTLYTYTHTYAHIYTHSFTALYTHIYEFDAHLCALSSSHIYIVTDTNK